MQYIDYCRIRLKAGNGGRGVIAWRREPFYPEGGPFGGNGGKGGDIFIICDEDQYSLFHLRYTKEVKAQDGENGKTKLSRGKDGRNTYLKVPVGTTVKNSSGEIICDLSANNEKFLICKGGKGGRGNAAFKNSRNRAPKMYELGDLGEEIDVQLEINSLAQVGLLGLPNAGKSTLLSAISKAKPKVADYRFTTVIPVLGTVYWNNKKLVFADIPGIIKEASKGKGLGLEFLKHLSRCQILLQLIPVDSENLIEEYQIIEDEIRSYSEELYQKKRIIVLTKDDLENNGKKIAKLKSFLLNKHQILTINVLDQMKLEKLLETVFLIYKNIRSKHNKINEIKKINVVQKIHEHDDDELVIFSNNQKVIDEDKKDLLADIIFCYDVQNEIIVESKWLKYWVHKIPQETDDNICWLKKKFMNNKLSERLIRLGLKKEQIVNIYGLMWKI